MSNNQLIPLTQELVKTFLESKEQFPIDFEKAWSWMGYSTKGSAKRLLVNPKSKLIEGTDYKLTSVLIGHGKALEQIYLTNRCFKKLCMLSKTDKGDESREYFINCEEKYKEIISKPVANNFQIPGTLSEALLLAGKLAKENEDKEKEIKKLKPLAEYAKLSFNAIQSVPLSAFGKFLSGKVLSMGRNKVTEFLLNEKLIFRNRSGILEPYSQYLRLESKQRFFDLKERTYKRPVYSKPKNLGGEKIAEKQETYFQILILKSGMEKIIELLYQKGLINSQQYISISNDIPIWLNTSDLNEDFEIEMAV